MECKDQTVLKLSKYMEQVFLSSEYSHDKIGRFLNEHIDPKYLRSNGERCMNELYDAYRAFYEPLGEEWLMSHNVMTRIFRGRPGLFGYVCQLALFEGISAVELLKDGSDVEEYDIFVRVSKRTGEPIDRVRLIGEAMLDELKKDSAIRTRSIRQKISLDKEDEKLAPRVREIASEMYGAGEKRPRKVTVTAVSKIVRVDAHKLTRMKHCIEAMKPYMETQECYWARELVWAVHEIEMRIEPLTLKRLGRLVSLKRREIESCMDELRKIDSEVYDVVHGVLCDYRNSSLL